MTFAELQKHIVPININGLNGRMLAMRAPKGKKREILYIYGHHSSIERGTGFIEDLNQYGAVTVPDLPGFGGMDSFYKIGMKPTLDNMADYVASFIKMRYKRKKVTVIGLSYGFMVLTRMLQRYPELNKKIDILISVVGFSHKDDFSFSKNRYNLYLMGAKIAHRRLPAFFIRNLLLNPFVIRNFYSKTFNAKKKFAGLDDMASKRATEMEVTLWRANDVRTHMSTSVDMLTVDNCQVPIARKLWHISFTADQYFDSKVVEQHLRIIFDEVEVMHVTMDKHAPSVISSKDDIKDVIPVKLRRMLNKDPN